MKLARGSSCILLQLVLFCGAVFAPPEAQAQETVRNKTTTIHERTTTIHETRVEEHEEEKRTTLLTAIFIKNRSGAAFQDKLGAFEDLLIGEVTDMGFRVMSPGDTVNALRNFLGTPPDESVPGAKLDELLANNTSAVRLAQNMGVDFILVASITTFGSDTQHLKRPDLGIDRTVTDYKLRATYKVIGASRGESLSAGNVLASRRLQSSATLEENSDVANDLLADAAVQIASKLESKGGTGAVPQGEKAAEFVNFVLSCSMQDMTVPEVIKDESGEYILSANRYKLETLAVTVELDGVVIGSAPGEFQALPGLHKIRLTREGFEDWERTISVREGQILNVALTLTPEGRAYWLQMADFFARLKRDERIAEADAELIRGVAQKMRQSGIRIDKKVDVKVDTTDAPSVSQVNVDQQNVAASVWP